LSHKIFGLKYAKDIGINRLGIIKDTNRTDQYIKQLNDALCTGSIVINKYLTTANPVKTPKQLIETLRDELRIRTWVIYSFFLKENINSPALIQILKKEKVQEL
jgi:hypothetical protein